MQILVKHEELTDIIVSYLDDINCFLSTCRTAKTPLREKTLVDKICTKYYSSMCHAPLQLIRQLPLKTMHVQSLKLDCPGVHDICRFKLSYKNKIYLVISETETIEIEQGVSTKIIETTANQAFNGEAIVKGVNTFADDRYLCVITFLHFDVALYMHILNLETKQWTMKHIAGTFDMLQVTSIIDDNSFTMTTATVSDDTLRIGSCIVNHGLINNIDVFTKSCAGASVMKAVANFREIDKQVLAYTHGRKVHLIVVSGKVHVTLVELDSFQGVPSIFYLTPVLDYLVIRHMTHRSARSKGTFESLVFNVNKLTPSPKVVFPCVSWCCLWERYIPAVPLNDGSFVEIFHAGKDLVKLRVTRFFNH